MKIVAILPAACMNFEHPGIKGEIKTLLADLSGKPLLQHVIERLKCSKMIDEIIITTSDREVDKVVVDLARKWDVKVYVGKDYGKDFIFFKWVYEAAIEEKSDYIVHVATLLPFIDVDILDKTIQFHLESNSNYTMPTGWMGFVIWSPEMQQKYYLFNAGEISDLYSPKIFHVANSKLNFYNLVVVTEYKLEIARVIYNRLYSINKTFGYEELTNLYDNEPKIFSPYPSVVNLELTNDCNLSCNMCPRNKMTREIGYMDFDLYKRIIDELPSGTEINLSMLGEPLMHPDILKMIEYGAQKGIEIYLYTNGVLLDKDVDENLLKSDLAGIIISLDAATKETYVKIKGIDTFDKVVENITRFLKLKKEKIAEMEKDIPIWWSKVKPIVGIQIIKMKETDAEIEEFMNKWDYMDKAKKMINYRSRVQKAESVDAELWGTIYSKFLPIEHAIIGHFNCYCGQIEDRSAIDVTPLKRFPCKQLQSGISVLWNGDIAMCPQDFNGKIILDNVGEDSISGIWKGKKLEDIWQVHQKGEHAKLPLCSQCKEWYYSLK